MRRHPFAAVNLISDPIHGYIELTKRLTPAESAARRACPTRRSPRRTCSTRPGSSGCAGSASSRAPAGSSRPPSTRGSPTASGSCTRPGCGRARSIRACATALTARRRRRPVRGPGRRDAPDRRPPPRRRPRAVRPLLRRPRPGRLSRAARPASAGRQAAHPRGPLAAHHRARAGRLIGGLRRAPGAVAERDAFADGEAIDPALGLVPRLEAGPRRRGDAALGPLAPAAAVGRLHRRQPRLRPARRVPDRRRHRTGRRRAAAALRLHLGPGADALRAGPRRRSRCS